MPLCSDRKPSEQMRRHAGRRGRPRVPERMEPVTVRLPPSVHDAACRRALTDGSSIGEVIREALERDLGITV